MADNIVLLKIDVQEANANDRLERLRKSTKDLKEGSDEYVLVLKKIQIEEDRLANLQAKRIKIQNNSVKDTERVTSALNNQKDATGSATAATMELSRIVSDAPYGIRGMANNITQLVSQLGTASKSAGGLGAAIKLMISQLMGPLGVVFAITAAVSAFDYFYGGAKKAAKAMKEFTSISYAQSLVAEQYVDILEDVNTTESYRAVAVQELIKLVPELKEEDLAYGKNLDKVREQIALYSLAQASRIEIDKLVQDNSELLSRKNELENIKNIKNEKEMLEEMSKFIFEQGKEVSGFYVGFGVKKLIEEKDLVQTKETFNRLSKIINSQSKPIIERIQKLTKLLRLDPNKSSKDKDKVKKISPFKTPKELELDVKNNEAALLAFAKKTELQLLKNKESEELNAAKTEKQRSIIKKRYARLALIAQIENEKKVLLLKKATEKAILQGKYDTFQKEAELRRLAYIDTINKSELTEKQKEEAIKKANADTAKLTTAAFKEQQAELGEGGVFETRWKATLAAFETLKEARLKFTDVSKLDDDKIKTDLARWTKYAETAKAIISTITDFVDGEFNRQLTIEQNKTNALNNELNKRLLDENLSKDEREKIQNEIAQNDEKLRLKQERIEKKRFKMQKAVNIATTLINTAVAAAGVMAQAEGGFFARLSQAIPTIAFGLAQVATIARTKFQSSAGSSPALVGGGSSGGSARAEPSFNIVGRSNENVLLSAIQSQFDQPLRAYVVARDVTNQQQLDGVISGAAST